MERDPTTLEEIWKPLPEFLNLSKYEVSSEGRIRTSNRILMSKPRNNGYIYTTLTNDNGEIIVLSNHQLVAHAFLSLDPDRKYIDHINGDKTDNRLINLRRVTSRENALNPNTKDSHGRKGRPVVQLDKDGSIIKIWNSALEAANVLGTHGTTIGSCCKNRGIGGKNKSVTAAGFQWRYADEVVEHQEEEEWREVMVGDVSVTLSSLGRVKTRTAVTYGSKSMGSLVHCVYGEDETKRIGVHTLVCRAFHGESPKPNMRAHHIDGDTRNNRASNLEWKTLVEKAKHRKQRATSKGATLIEQYDLTGKHIRTHRSASIAANVTGVSRSNIYSCCTNKSKTAGGYIWKYVLQTDAKTRY
jgi:hypothetical protein